MKRFFGFLFSMQFAGTLILIFAAAIGTATFIENDFGTIAAKVIVYNATWFEILLLITTISLVGSMFKYRLIQRKKYTALIFHLAFVLIMLGAAITRYISYEGSISIREGESSNELSTISSYVQVWVEEDGAQYRFDDKYLFSNFKKNRFHEKYTIGENTLTVGFKEFIPNAATTLVPAPGGKPYVSFVTVNAMGSRSSAFLGEGETYAIDSATFDFRQVPEEGNIAFTFSQDTFRVVSPYDFSVFSMMQNQTDTIRAGEVHAIQKMKLYSFKGKQVVFREFYPEASTKIVPASVKSNQTGIHAVFFDVSFKGETKEIMLLGAKGVKGTKESIEIGGTNIEMAYGSKTIELPFSLYLRDFQLERYPGSNSPSSYASEVTLIDPRDGTEFDYRIFMNNILNYDGYRFFQSSYDQDERGTIFSVNHDQWGTLITYAGYFVLTVGFLANFFSRRSRFRKLARASKEMRELSKKTTVMMVIALIAIGSAVNAQHTDHRHFNTEYEINAEHASKFGELIVQNRDGRMQPMNTLTNEILRKVHRKEKLLGLNADQVFLGMASNPAFWQTIPMIKVTSSELKSFIGSTGKYAAFNDFIDMGTGGYKLSKAVEEAYQKKPVERDRFDKDVIAVDERVNIVYMVYTGDFLNIFPKPDDPNNKWYKAEEADQVFDTTDAGFVNNILTLYYQSINEALVSGDWSKPDEYLGFIKTFQERYGSEIFPPGSKVNLEIAYNEINPFKRLFPYYAFTGLVLIILMFVNILKSKWRFRIPVLVFSWLIYLGFIFHTAGLAVRWYIGGHAPWTNGYETMIFISWGIILSGIIFSRRSRITLATTGILAALTLMVANLSWLDPEITSLVPVLRSYWLVLHVAVITSSYSFLGIGALLGFLNLLLMNFRNEKNNLKLGAVIKELTNIIEMNLIIGLFLLTIGTFLGAVWANESWGRYWGWDPKETWALVTVLVYSFVIHMRMIPGLNGLFAFNFASLISFSSVLMTYFGVNYYLSGLHSYAKGDPVPIPSFVYYTLAIIAVVSVFAYINYLKSKKLPQVAENLDPENMS
jgi:cytochrome c-type biogenesis protein CcsB